MAYASRKGNCRNTFHPLFSFQVILLIGAVVGPKRHQIVSLSHRRTVPIDPLVSPLNRSNIKDISGRGKRCVYLFCLLFDAYIDQAHYRDTRRNGQLQLRLCGTTQTREDIWVGFRFRRVRSDGFLWIVSMDHQLIRFIDVVVSVKNRYQITTGVSPAIGIIL